MHFGNAVELGDPSFLVEAALEVNSFICWEGLLVPVDEELELAQGTGQPSLGLSFCQSFVGFAVEEVLVQAFPLVPMSIHGTETEVFVSGFEHEVHVVW